MGTSLAVPKVPEFAERSRELQFAEDKYHQGGGGKAKVTPSFSDFSFYPDKYNITRSQQQKGFDDQKVSSVGVAFTEKKRTSFEQHTPSGFDVAFTQEQESTIAAGKSRIFYHHLEQYFHHSF